MLQIERSDDAEFRRLYFRYLKMRGIPLKKLFDFFFCETEEIHFNLGPGTMNVFVYHLKKRIYKDRIQNNLTACWLYLVPNLD